MSWGENVTRSAFEEFESLRFEEFRVSRSAFRVLFIGSIIYLKDKAVIR